jgi:rhodanese-related sulfurtransferase
MGKYMAHTEKFQKLADEAKAKIQEISIGEFTSLDKKQETPPILIDVREESEWQKSHIEGAIHLSRGIIELKIEEAVPALDAPIVCYCGGGNRSALVAESLQKLGYSNVQSLIGGFKAWEKSELPIATPEKNAD